jgi:O-antigen ligase
VSRRRVTDVLFLAALSTVSLIGLRWRIAGLQPKLADFLIVAFLVASLAEAAATRWRRPGRPVMVVLGFTAALAVAYLAAVPAIEERADFAQFCKGLAYFVLHFAFLAAGVSHLALRPPRFFRMALGCLLAGIAANGAYAGLQLVAAATGHNLDATVLSPLTGNPARSMDYGLMYGPDVLRARGVTRDPNHLGIMLLIPTLALVALSPRLTGLRRAYAAAVALAGLLVVLTLTLSRSAGVGLAAGLLFLVLVDGRRLVRRAVLVPAAAAVGALALVAANAETFERVLGARLGIYGFAGRQHFRTYELIRPALSEHLLFGVGLNNFTQTYAERVLGTLEASHSFYVQSLIETGILGGAVFALFLGYGVHRLRLLRASAQPHDAHSREVLASVLGAALVGTLAANAFYMTMSFSYFYAFLIFVMAAPTRFAPETRAFVTPRPLVATNTARVTREVDGRRSGGRAAVSPPR